MTFRSAIREAFAEAASCAECVHFCSDPARVEAALPGLAALSSAHASVRGADGLCLMHDRMINGRRRCEGFQGTPDRSLPGQA